MELAFAILGGLGLASACGFRVFLPPFLTSLAAGGYLGAGVQTPLLESAQFEWLSDPNLTVALGVATGLEIASFYIPWIDNLLDTLATPAAIVAGALLSSAVLPESAGDGTTWLVTGIAGGGVAGVVQGATVIARGISSLATAGLGNPIISTAEWLGALVTSILAMIAPFLALAALLLGLGLFIRWWLKRRADASRVQPASPLEH
ncbi:MAG: DUF4126 domain-containing protein [Myxococcota bacterium]